MAMWEKRKRLKTLLNTTAIRSHGIIRKFKQFRPFGLISHPHSLHDILAVHDIDHQVLSADPTPEGIAGAIHHVQCDQSPSTFSRSYDRELGVLEPALVPVRSITKYFQQVLPPMAKLYE